MTTTLTLDTIAPDETPFCGKHHRWPGDIAGFVVVLTRSGEGRLHDVEVFENENTGTPDQPFYPAYGRALEVVRTVRETGIEAGFYGRIDVLYNDGCRGIL